MRIPRGLPVGLPKLLWDLEESINRKKTSYNGKVTEYNCSLIHQFSEYRAQFCIVQIIDFVETF